MNHWFMVADIKHPKCMLLFFIKECCLLSGCKIAIMFFLILNPLLIAALSEIPIRLLLQLHFLELHSLVLIQPMILSQRVQTFSMVSLYVISIIWDILHHPTCTYYIFLLFCDHNIHPIFPSSSRSFFPNILIIFLF